MKFLARLSRIFGAKENNILLGRWRLKHDINNCENYIKNYYGEPGYPNQYKDLWIKKQQSKN